MHTIYEKLWLISSELNHLTKVNKKSLYMAISVMFWILVATIVCVVLEIFCKISYITLAAIIGYVAVIPGYFGAVMYIYRNTTPKDIEWIQWMNIK